MPKTNVVKLYVIRRKRKIGDGTEIDDYTYGIVVPKAVISLMKLTSGQKFKVVPSRDRKRIILNRL